MHSAGEPNSVKDTMPRKKKTEEDGQEENSETRGGSKKKQVVFDVLTEEGLAYLQEARSGFMAVQAAKTRRNLAVQSLEDVRRSFIPIDQIHWQWMTKCIGLPKEGLVEIYGPTGAGKTSLCLWLVNNIVRTERCPVLYLNTETKPMDAGRALRFFGESIEEATRIRQSVTFLDARSLSEMADTIFTWCNVMRGGHAKSKFALDRKSVPLVVVIDTLSMLLPPGEEKGFYDFDQNMYEQNKKAFKHTGTGSNLEFAKYMAAFIRRLNTMQNTHGLTAIIVHHPNEEINMDSSPAARFKAPESPLAKALKNTVSIGGRASKRLSALQLSLSPTGSLVRDPRTKKISGKQIIIKPEKNSYGPTTRSIIYELREEHEPYDDPGNGIQDTGLHFEQKTAEWLAENGYLGIQERDGLYTCPRLGLDKVTADVLCKEIHAAREVIKELGTHLGILGYDAALSDTVLVQEMLAGGEVQLLDEEPETKVTEYNNSDAIDENQT